MTARAVIDHPNYANFKFPPYQYRAYPKYVAGVEVANEEEHARLIAAWAEAEAQAAAETAAEAVRLSAAQAYSEQSGAEAKPGRRVPRE